MSSEKNYEIVTLPTVKDFLDILKRRNKSLHDEIMKTLKVLKKNLSKGKPLKNKLKNYRSLRVKKYRIIYKVKENEIRIYSIDKRETVYSTKF
jgi:mRNA-degrading endonuclease RelE of RelBE toxin-antitoxin system